MTPYKNLVPEIPLAAKKNINYINFSREELDELFSDSVNGNSAAFNKLSAYIRSISHSYFLSKFRKGKILNIEDVDDLTNSVYLAFAEQYKRINNPENWLRRVLFLNFVNWYKKAKSYKTFELDNNYHSEHSGLKPGDKADVDKILSLLNNLSEEKQQIIKMRFWEELKFGEIAETMNKSEDAVKKMFYRTIEELKNRL